MGDGWNCYAAEFNDCSIFDRQFIHTGLGLKGIDPRCVVSNSQRILDVGCGEGTNTYLMNSVNKVKTVGIDIAYVSIEKANKLYSSDTCEFLNCDLISFLDIYDHIPFDLVTFWGSLDYIRIDKKFFFALNQITKIGSRCFVSKFHPMWTSLYANDVGKQQLKSYFDNGRIDKIPYGNRVKVLLERFHYSISYIHNNFMDYGWKMISIKEPEPNISESSFKYKNYDSDVTLMKRMNLIPMTVIFEFMRV